MTDLEQQLTQGLAALYGQSEPDWQPPRDLASVAVCRVRRRRRTTALSACVAAAGVVAATVLVSASLGGRAGGQQIVGPVRPTPTSVATPAARSVDFTVGYLPPDYHSFNKEHGPTNVTVNITRRYQRGAPAHLSALIVTADFGTITSLQRYQRLNGPMHRTTVGGTPAVIGWSTGKPGHGLHDLYMLLGPNTAVDVAEVGTLTAQRLSDRQLKRVAASVAVTTTGLPSVTLTVPNVIGKSQQQAVRAITAAGLGAGSVRYDYHHHASEPPEHVEAQRPAPGSRVPSGTLVNLVLAPTP